MDSSGTVGHGRILTNDQTAGKGYVEHGFLVVELLAKHFPDLGGLHSIGAPIHIYPLYENGFRAHRGQSIKSNHEESTLLYENFSKVAERNPYAWNAGNVESQSSIGTVSSNNRMICFPCE